MKQYKQIFLLLFFITSFSFNQNADLITQQITIESAIKSKVDAIVTKFLKPSEYIVIVNAGLDFKPLPLESADSRPEQVNPETSYSVIPGLMPSMPARQSIYRKDQGGGGSYSTDKYILYRLEIMIYLDENINSGSLQNDIKTLVEMNLTEIICNDCVKFQIMEMDSSDSGVGPFP